MTGSKIGVICGGSGSSKFVTAIDSYLDRSSFDRFYVANVADNFWHYGIYICPDIDILMYSLAKNLDETKGWGIRNDTENFLRSYASIEPRETWFRLGDADLAFCALRTELLRRGWRLSQITEYLCHRLHIKDQVLPATDDEVQTHVMTTKGKMHLQEFWVKNHGGPKVTGIEYAGAESAKLHPSLSASLSSSFLILPANPVSSILPTLSIGGLRKELRRTKRVIAISPFLGRTAFSGPAAKFLRALNQEPSSFGVARLYSDFLRIFIVNKREDSQTVKRIKELGIECERANTRIQTRQSKQRFVLELKQFL